VSIDVLCKSIRLFREGAGKQLLKLQISRFANRTVRGANLLLIFQQPQQSPFLLSLEHMERVTTGPLAREGQPRLGNRSQQSQNQSAREMMLSLFVKGIGGSGLTICKGAANQRSVSWIQEESWQN
jgi:hypothetical protein